MKIKDCSLIPDLQEKPGYCVLVLCGAKLPARRRKWCSNKCNQYYLDRVYGEHEWNSARVKALARDHYRCRQCGSDGTIPKSIYDQLTFENDRDKWEKLQKLGRLYQLEVNHENPRRGKGYQVGCWNHLENLKTLCHACHLKVTAQQRVKHLLDDKKASESLWEGVKNASHWQNSSA
jgi:5-methylcytosine-specific restriction endonuclease McrA